MYYFVTFDPIEGATRKQITDAYNRFVKHFEKSLSLSFQDSLHEMFYLGLDHIILLYGNFQTFRRLMNGMLYLVKTNRDRNSLKRFQPKLQVGKQRLC